MKSLCLNSFFTCGCLALGWIGWKDSSIFVELPLPLGQRSFDSVCIRVFTGSQFCFIGLFVYCFTNTPCWSLPLFSKSWSWDETVHFQNYIGYFIISFCSLQWFIIYFSLCELWYAVCPSFRELFQFIYTITFAGIQEFRIFPYYLFNVNEVCREVPLFQFWYY